MFRLSHTLWKENLACGGVMAVRLSVCLSPLLTFEPSGGLYWNLYIYIVPLEITPPLYSFNFLSSEILACLLCHVVGESDISGTRSTIFKCCVICLGKIFSRNSYRLYNKNMAAMQNLHSGRSLVRFPIVALEFFIDIILSAILWSWGRLNLWQKWVPGIFSVR